jgi:hypothetical protein
MKFGDDGSLTRMKKVFINLYTYFVCKYKQFMHFLV